MLQKIEVRVKTESPGVRKKREETSHRDKADLGREVRPGCVEVRDDASDLVLSRSRLGVVDDEEHSRLSDESQISRYSSEEARTGKGRPKNCRTGWLLIQVSCQASMSPTFFQSMGLLIHRKRST
jgi:hypothetical protein